tara:strand:- start:272 stop:460 length:189 start_codon:yes stop_codon:yes gene_type:complete
LIDANCLNPTAHILAAKVSIRIARKNYPRLIKIIYIELKEKLTHIFRPKDWKNSLMRILIND